MRVTRRTGLLLTLIAIMLVKALVASPMSVGEGDGQGQDRKPASHIVVEDSAADDLAKRHGERLFTN